MPTITAATLISRAQTIIQDVAGVRWPSSELLGWLNDGQREIVALNHSANSKTANLTCAAGTKQTIPTDGITLMDVVRNMGTSGTVPGTAVRMVSRTILDAQLPDWHSSTSSTVIKHYCFDARTPKNFYVYPPAQSGTKLEIVYAATPTDVAVAGDTIALDDIYANALVDYMLFRAYSKDTEFAGNASRAAAARQSFENSLGLKAQSDAASDAQANIPG